MTHWPAMGDSITLPLWLFVVLLVTASLLILDRVLLPGFRWYLRRRVNRVIDDVNSRLHIEIRPFQLTRKQALVDQLVFDEKVVAAMREYAAAHDMPREVVQARVFRYAKEVAPSFNAYIYFRFGYWLAKKLGRMLYRVRVGFYDDARLQRIDPNASVVFVMNHRSNMDYVLLSFLVAERTALSYAVGEWARVWPLQTLIKAMGAFFVRRDSGNPLYRRVLERYVNLATRAGVCQAVFLEGGLTRDGRLGKPKLGFLDYMLREYRPQIDRDVVFVPVGINYDRVIEDLSLLRRLDPTAERRSLYFVVRTSIRFAFKTLMSSPRKRWLRFGYAAVNFGRPLSMSEYCQRQALDWATLDQSERFAQVDRLGSLLMQEISRVVPVLPIALTSEILLQQPGAGRSELEIKAQAMARIKTLERDGAPIRMTAGACDDVLTAALTMLQGRGFVETRAGLLFPRQNSLDALRYYANSIAHWRSSGDAAQDAGATDEAERLPPVPG